MTSLDERGAEALQELVTPASFERIATQLEEAQREKQRKIDQRTRITQGKSSARIVGQPELASGARVDSTELSRKAQKKYLNMVHTKYLERKTQIPKKSDKGNPGNQTKRLNSLHDKCVQMSLNNHCHFIVFTLCENTKQFSSSVKAYGPLAHTFLQSRCGEVLVGSFFEHCDNVQDERVSLGKQYPYKGYECAGDPEPAPTLTPPPEEKSENEEESETQENDGLGIQNRDDEDPETITHIPQLSSPVVEPNSNRVQGGVRGDEEESETQENDGLSIQNRDDEDPDTITHVPRLSSSTVKRPNSKHVQADVRKRAKTSLQATQEPKASEVAIVDQEVRPVIKEIQKMTKDQAIAAGKKLFERYLSSKPKEDNSIEVCLVQDMINGWEQPETFLAQLKIVTKSNYSNVPHLLESIKDMLPHVQQALVSKEMSIEGIAPPFLFDQVLMTEAHALSSGPMFIARILDRIMQQKKTMQAKSQDVSLVQHMIYEWLKPQDFICRINEILKLNIPETENNFNSLKVALKFIGHGLRSGKVQIAGIVAPADE